MGRGGISAHLGKWALHVQRFAFVQKTLLVSSSAGLWNLVFLFSNLSLVFLMPFAYFFTEAEGFAGSKKVPAVPLTCPPARILSASSLEAAQPLLCPFSPQGIMARVYETFVVLLLLTLLVLGMVWVASAIVDNDTASRESLYGEWHLLVLHFPFLWHVSSKEETRAILQMNKHA